MDHSEAAAMNAAERYVLGDLKVPEVEAFERHFFDCPQCSEELRALALLQDNARAVFLDPSADPVPALAARSEQNPGASPASRTATGRGSSWWRTIWRPAVLAPTFAMLAVGIFAGYEIASRSQTAQPVSSFPLYAASRGSETVVAPPKSAQFYTLYLDRTWDEEYASYRAVVREEAGNKDQIAMPVALPSAGGAIQFLISGHALAAGRHVLVIYGVDRSGRETVAARYPFLLRLE